MTKPTVRAWECGECGLINDHSPLCAIGKRPVYSLSRHSDMAVWLRLKAETIRVEESSKYGHTADHQVIANEIREWADELDAPKEDR